MDVMGQSGRGRVQASNACAGDDDWLRSRLRNLLCQDAPPLAGRRAWICPNKTIWILERSDIREAPGCSPCEVGVVPPLMFPWSEVFCAGRYMAMRLGLSARSDINRIFSSSLHDEGRVAYSSKLLRCAINRPLWPVIVIKLPSIAISELSSCWKRDYRHQTAFHWARVSNFEQQKFR